MKLFIFACILAISLAKEIKNVEIEGVVDEEHLDSIAEASTLELKRTSRNDKETLDTAASTYNNVPPSQRPPRPWNNYVPNQQNTWNNPAQNNYNPPLNNYNPAQVVPPVNNYIPQTPQNDYVPPQNYQPTVPQNNYQPAVPQNNYQPSVPQNNYQPSVPQNNYQPSVPQNNYQPSVPQNNYQPSVPQNNYQPTVPQNNYKPPIPQNPPVGPSTPTPQNPQNDYYVAVIKNEQYIGENGNYKYEYQIADGTHVGEEGYLTNPNTDNESVVKKGWYSYVGGDGRVYTVRWWADDSGYHAFGDHLPTPPPVPPAIQAALDQAAKEEANKPTQPTYYPQPTQPPTYYPQPTQQPTYYPQQTYYPNNNYGK